MLSFNQVRHTTTNRYICHGYDVYHAGALLAQTSTHAHSIGVVTTMRGIASLLLLLWCCAACNVVQAVWDEYAWTRATWDAYKFTLPATFYKAAISPRALRSLEAHPALEGAKTCSLFGAHLDAPPAPAQPTSLMCVHGQPSCE